MNSILNFLFDCYTLSPYKRGRPNIKSVNITTKIQSSIEIHQIFSGDKYGYDR
jgi:hypothetical protein